ncbi:hypothetical protein GCM10008938_52340 [Deinococcus roseus]|uniref:Uncharacterized protein n=1 Tax=Deinococcus roseus TaxID=392414 RepID=A0ABQ2DJ05_9DEIO|nr:hypothetical protein GCM10008938_52340 [Deinococcus roseus]
MIIDEAQVMSKFWIEILETWFKTKRIYAFCDETQVFSYEESISNDDLARILNIDQKNIYTLTLNLRSPKPVFKRLEEALPSTYQQFSPRPDDNESLTEIVDFRPEVRLFEILEDLMSKGINKNDIAVVYVDNLPAFPSYIKEYKDRMSYLYREHLMDQINIDKILDKISQKYENFLKYEWLEKSINEPVFIGKFRGLEAPVVIVYAGNSVDTKKIACSYARSTTHCIAIYSISAFLRRQKDVDFLNVVLRNSPDIQKAVDEIWPFTKLINLKRISAEHHIYWNKYWGGWFIWNEELIDPVLEYLWLSHFLNKSKLPSYIVNTNNERWSVKKVLYEPSINDYTHVHKKLEWCYRCNRWTLHETEINVQWCIECNEEFGDEFDENNLKDLDFHEDIINNPRSYKKDDFKNLPIFITLIGMYKKLSREDRSYIASIYDDLESMDDPTKFAFRIGIGLILLKIKPGDPITTEEILEKWAQWFPEIVIDDSKKTSFIRPSISKWIKKGLIKKPNKNSSNVYIRLDYNDQDQELA